MQYITIRNIVNKSQKMNQLHTWINPYILEFVTKNNLERCFVMRHS